MKGQELAILNDQVIVQLNIAQQALDTALTVQETKLVIDMAHSAYVFAKRQGLAMEHIARAHSIEVDAQRKLGLVLIEAPKAEGTKNQIIGGSRGNAKLTGGYNLLPPVKNTPTLEELGIDKRTSTISQKIAVLPETQYAEVKSGEKSLTQVLREMKAEQIRVECQAPDAKYRIIYADPPWSYGNTQPDYHTEQRDHYPVTELNELCEMPVKDWCEDNAVLFLWVTSPILEDSFKLIKAWGFKYKTSFVWDKIKHNMGHYNSVRHELLLVCTRGSCTPDVTALFDSVQSIERTKHSEKPEMFRTIIDTLYHTGDRIELFCRGVAPDNWTAWGNEASEAS